ncbi:MAG: SDR family oxidoreductase [Myxococcota bacterium]|jgi:peroxisomal 2,4-dienoyl-CoA reductase|nr:SDR family oxidoreductase [Myxococcota bacterium]
MSVFREDLLASKVALVTGGATGIGREIARTLGRHGARVCIASRKQENLEGTTGELRAEGIDAMWLACDIRDGEQVDRLIAGVRERFAALDIVVNNAAGNFPAPITGISYNGFRAVVDIDLRGTYNVSKAAFEAFLKANGGHIVNITAPFQNMGVSLQAHVAAAKAGVDSLTRTCAVEFGPYGVRVNAVAPGATADTEGLDRFEGVEGAASDSPCPLGYVGSKQDIANMVLVLVSEAASYVTGQVIAVDGGTSIDLFKLSLPES